MPVSLVALKKLTYAGETYVAGEAFEARDIADAVVLKMTKLAEEVKAVPVTPETVPIPEPVEAVDDTADGSPPRRRRAYRRRVLPAET